MDTILSIATNGTGEIFVLDAEGNTVAGYTMNTDEFTAVDREAVISMVRDAIRNW